MEINEAASFPGMMVASLQPERREVLVTVPFPPDFVYSNCAAFSLSAMDFRISFAEAMPDGHAEARVGVVLPPEQAATLAIMLIHQLTTFEERFGEIRHPGWKAIRGVTASLPVLKSAEQNSGAEPKKE
jgi:uncharacterized protein DUF3467